MKKLVSDHFATLGLSPGAPPAEVRRAYLALVKRWHPDRFAHDPAQLRLAEEKLRTINVAYENLVGEARVTQVFQRDSIPPAYDPADEAKMQGRAA